MQFLTASNKIIPKFKS